MKLPVELPEQVENFWRAAQVFYRRRSSALPGRWRELANELCTAVPATALFVTGRVIQNYPHDYPEFLRWHLTNTVDAVCFATYFNIFPILVLRRSHPAASAAMALFAGVIGEFHQAGLPGGKLDIPDILCYAAGAAAYITARKALTQRSARQVAHKAATPKDPAP